MSGNSLIAGASRPGASFHPLFGIEIEIFVKVKSDVQARVLRKRAQGSQLQDHWARFDFGLRNDIDDWDTKYTQNFLVGRAIEVLLQNALGPDNGWSCVPDGSLYEDELRKPADARKYCTVPFSYYSYYRQTSG
jgi:hypothetical protein